MRALAVFLTLCTTGSLRAQDQEKEGASPIQTDAMIVVIGAGGSSEFEGEFDAWAEQWELLAKRQHWSAATIHNSEDSVQPKELLRLAIEARADARRLWIVLLGHGTFARNVAKFNLVGPDVSAPELRQWLSSLDSQVVVVNCSSSSGPFLTELAGQRRVLVTATRSGSEMNYARFGKFLSGAVNDARVDIDHDKEVSLLEAFLAASSQTERFYLDDSRLATEHALLNDNGDKVGTSADFYRGIRPVKEGKDGLAIDGGSASRLILLTSPDNPVFTAELDEKRSALEQQLEVLRGKKRLLARDDYFEQLEALLLQLAEVYDQAEEQ